MHDCSTHHSKMTHFTHCNCIINFQKPKVFPILFGWENERCPEIVFSVHQNAENEHNETLNIKGD